MRTFVVDASVGAKWFLPASDEPLAAEAHELLDHYTRGQIRLFVPDLFWAELGNVLWKAVKRNRLTLPEAGNAIAQAHQLDLYSLPSLELMNQALQTALTSGRSFYDSVYVAAALMTQVPLLTADEKLFNAAGGRLPVRWLAALQSLL